MRKRIISILQYVFFLAVGIFLVWWQLKSLTPEQKVAFMDAFNDANYWLIIPVVILTLLSHFSRAIRWKLLMEPLNYRPAVKNVFAVILLGYFANAAFPRLGEILKCTFLARYEKLKVDKLVGTIIVEKAFDFVCYIIFIGLTILIQVDIVWDFLKQQLLPFTINVGFPIWAKMLILISAFAILFLLTRLLFKKFPGNKVIIVIKSFLRGILEGFISIRNLKRRWLFILHTIFIWGTYLLQVYLAFFAMKGTSHLGIGAAFSVLTLVTLAMIITPGGIGSFPIFVKETLIIYGIAPALGIAFGWLMWGISTGIVIIAGLAALLLLPIMNKHKKHEIHTVDPL